MRSCRHLLISIPIQTQQKWKKAFSNTEKWLYNPGFDHAYIHILKSAALGSNSYNLNENWKEQFLQNSRPFIKKADWLMSVRIRMQTSFSSTDYEIGGFLFVFFCMVQLVGVLYITATVVHSIQTLKWQTFDICLTLF